MPPPQTSASTQVVKPSAAETGSSRSVAANEVRVSGAKTVEVWVKVTVVTAGQLDSIDLLASPLEKPSSSSPDDFASVASATINVTAVGMFKVLAVARENADLLGRTLQVSWVMSASPNLTFEVLIVEKS